MPIPISMADLSVTASANSPQGTESPTQGDDFLRNIQAIIRSTNAKGADIASAGTTDIGAATGEFVDVTGTATITSLGTAPAGIVRTVRFTGASTLTHNAATLILPNGANIVNPIGNVAQFRSLGAGSWVCVGALSGNANSISATPSGNLSGVTIQAQLNELDAEKLSNAPITTAETVGSASLIPVITKDANGRVTEIATAVNPTLGVGQTYQTVTRLNATTYTNATGKPIELRARLTNNANTVGAIFVNINGGGNISLCECGGSSLGQTVCAGSIIIQPLATYLITIQNAASTTFSELR